MVIALYLITTLTINFGTNDVNCARDVTLTFDWIIREGRLELIYNANDLTDYEKNNLLPNLTYS